MSGNSKFPWYKERLKTKYSKDVNPVYHHKNWTFLKTGLDDFRDGFPPDEDEIIIKPKRGPSPIFTGLDDSTSSSNNSKASRSYNSRKLSPEEIIYSSKIPNAERKWKRVIQLEENLLAHPLALFPNLEQGINPDLYEEIVDILDPDLLDMIGSDDESEASNQSENMVQPKQEDSEDLLNASLDSIQSENTKLDYSRILKKNKNQGVASKTAELELHERKIKNIAKEFCKWSEELGEGGPCLEEETIEALFASGYSQAKQSSGPVHVVELNSIPPELRAKAGLTIGDKQTKLEELHKSVEKPAKYRYGAWYLKPETWTRLEKSEMLKDPNANESDETTESRKHAQLLHAQLAPLHGAKAFRQYLERTGKKKPEFIKEISKIQDDTQKENNK